MLSATKLFIASQRLAYLFEFGKIKVSSRLSIIRSLPIPHVNIGATNGLNLISRLIRTRADNAGNWADCRHRLSKGWASVIYALFATL
jgi:hypothetical protein